MTGQAATVGAVLTRARVAQAAAVGMAVGAGLAARYLAGRGTRTAVEGVVDWSTAHAIAARRLRSAPGSLTPAELARVVPAYARAMERIVPLLEQRLGAAMPGVVERHEVVDRQGWARANADVFRDLVGHLEAATLSGRSSSTAAGVAMMANRFLATRQVGFLLGYLGTRVLGQYDIALLSAEGAPGRLLFVEENIRATARSLGIPLGDFRTWIALHEATHAFEMEAHPWLRPYLRERLERQISGFLGEAREIQAGGLRHLITRWRAAASEGSLVGFMSAEQRGLLRETQLVMSLMEGFSDWVMDEVGEQVLPDVAGIRQRFEARRRQRRRGVDRIIARLTGLDLKMEQYRRGERFVAGVFEAGGNAAIGHLWDGPASLPTDAEMDDPPRWVQRIMPAANDPGHAAGQTVPGS
jgi:coenzyme F420 biosynthesis associated uncharacterized protein